MTTASLSAETLSSQETAKKVDGLLVSEVFSGVSPPVSLAPPADDQTFLRRVSLDLIGRLPLPAEVITFTLDTDTNKRDQIVAQLIDDPRYGLNWAHYWRDVILYRRTEQRALVTASALTDYLTQEFNSNTPWHQITSQFITAKGDVRENGNTALIAAQSAKPEETVSEIARIFMGIQIQCAQCHDHPYDRWTRQQFHELAAFFPRVAMRPNRMAMQRSFVVVANDRPPRRRRKKNNNKRVHGTMEHYMPDLENPTARGTLMQPALFSTSQQLDPGVPDAERRATLAEWITSRDNKWFAKAYVNRMWSELIGEGFHEPVDDLSPDRETHAPKTFEFLTNAFADTGYDTKWLVRTLMATETYHRASRPRRQGDEPPFTANRAQRLRADQIFDALLGVMNTDEASLGRRNGGGRPARGNRPRRNGPRNVFDQLFGYDPSDPRVDISGSIPQALAMMNSRIIYKVINPRSPQGLGQWLDEYQDDRELVTELYLRCLAREPTQHDLTTNLLYIRRSGNRAEGFEDVLWSVINSAEFLYRT